MNLKYTNSWSKIENDEALSLSGPIFIIGASGFIGANLFYCLSNLRNDVFACSRNPKRSWRLQDADVNRLITLDITEYDSLKRIIQEYRPRTIINLSAYGAYARQTDAEKIHQTNYIGTLNLIRTLQETGCDAFVNIGSSSEYGLNCKAPLEKDELIPNSDYAVSKVGASYLIKYYGEIFKFPCVNLRLYSIYGPFEERDRLIPTLISNCLKGKLPQFTDKTISRDFVYIDDCCNAIIKSALTACKTNQGASINIATGKKTTIEDVAMASKKIFNISEEPQFGSMTNRKWDLSNWFGDTKLAIEILKWEAKTDFINGLKYTADWEKLNGEKIKYINIPKSTKKISVIVACYKDNQSIPILHQRLTEVFKKIQMDYEIIFVNDCSPFNDEEIIHNLAQKDPHVIGISHSRNFGSQSAFFSGMEISTGDAVVLMDGDGQDPPEIIEKFVVEWNNGYEIVYGSRQKREAPFYMQFFYKLFYRIFKNLADIKIPVDAGDFSLIDRKAVNYILKFTEKDIFIRGLRAWVGFKQIGVPYFRPERLFGRSTNNFLKNIWWAKKAIFSFSMKPLYYIQFAGFSIFIASIFLSIFYLIKYFMDQNQAPKGFITLLLITLGLGGIILISLSIIGDYISKITEEVKNRPRYIRNKILYNGTIYDDENKITEIINKIQKEQ